MNKKLENFKLKKSDEKKLLAQNIVKSAQDLAEALIKGENYHLPLSILLKHLSLILMTEQKSQQSI